VKILHHISLNGTEDEKKAFQDVGADLQIFDHGLSLRTAILDITEDDPRWESVIPLIKKFRAVDIQSTKFTERELSSARYLALHPSWHHGYPQPDEDDFGYLKATYDLRDYCSACGIGKKQIAPFRMKKPPKWGRNSILQMNWVFDEYFLKPDIGESVFQSFDIGLRPVLLDKTGARIESVVQLEVPALVDLQMGDHPYEVCPTCQRKRYPPNITGFFPAPPGMVSPLFKSSQYFGSGARSFRAVLISNELYQRIRQAEVRGIDFQACAASGRIAT
jgi:hypothetical protein